MRIAPILLLHATTLLLVSIVMCKLAPGLQDYYQHANIEIPDSTSNVIRLSEFCLKFSLPIFCTVLIADFAFMLMLTSWERSKRWPLSTFSQIFVLFALVIVVYAAVWLSNPIIWLVP